MNEINRSMGLLDLVPEVLVGPVRAKTSDIHDLVTGFGRRPLNQGLAKLPPTDPGPPYLGRCREIVSDRWRQGDAGRFADPGVSVVVLRLLERGDGILGLFVKLAEFEGGAAADVVAPDAGGLRSTRGRPLPRRPFPAARWRRDNPLFVFARLQVRDQLVGRFPVAAAAARQQAKQQNQTCLPRA